MEGGKVIAAAARFGERKSELRGTQSIPADRHSKNYLVWDQTEIEFSSISTRLNNEMEAMAEYSTDCHREDPGFQSFFPGVIVNRSSVQIIPSNFYSLLQSGVECSLFMIWSENYE